MRRPVARRQGLRETLRANAAADRYYAGMFGKEPMAQPDIKPKRTVIRKADPTRVLEKHVLKAVLQFLRAHPLIASVERSQSGLFQEGNRIVRVGFVGKLDVTFMTKTGRYGEIEVKRPGMKPSIAQAARIEKIRSNGGISGCVTSVEDVQQLLGE